MKSGTESDVTDDWVDLDISHWCVSVGTTVGSDNDIDGFDGSLELLVKSLHIVLEGSQSQIKFVQEKNWLDSFGDSLSENGLGLDTDTGDGIDDDEGTIGDS